MISEGEVHTIVNMHNTSSETKQIEHLLRTSIIAMLHFQILNDQTVQVSKPLVLLAVLSVNTSPHKFQRSITFYSEVKLKWLHPPCINIVCTVNKLSPFPPEINPNTICILFKDLHKIWDPTLPTQKFTQQPYSTADHTKS
jgi:hypothetical protein